MKLADLQHLTKRGNLCNYVTQNTMYLCQTTYYDVWCFGKTLFLIVSPSKDGHVLMALRNRPGEFGPVTIRPSGIFGEFGLLLENPDHR